MTKMDLGGGANLKIFLEFMLYMNQCLDNIGVGCGRSKFENLKEDLLNYS